MKNKTEITTVEMTMLSADEVNTVNVSSALAN